MGYIFISGFCALCGRLFSANPRKVITVRVSTVNGKVVGNPNAEAKPVCRDCAERLNAVREQVGQPPFPIANDAYEPADESELG